MDPLAVIRTIWRQKWFALPAIAIAVGAAVYVYTEGPREYEATLSYAVANPQVPTDDELRADPALKELNSDNPYLRSSDPTLVGSVVMTRLNAPETADQLAELGLSTDYEAAPGVGGSGLVVAINASATSPDLALATLAELGVRFDENLREIQQVNGADDRYLFTPILVSAPDRATEKLSSRVRTVVIVGICGVVLVFGAISLGTWTDSRRAKRAARTTPADDGEVGSEVGAEWAAFPPTATADRARPRPRPKGPRPLPVSAHSSSSAAAESLRA
ncbi:chain-length determining protein [Microbacterium sp. P04]|uniref:chain-length determining protein n=1 Tax=Microbacterium sp. P04 TaxID=3366947 RepID=UPI0037476E56